MKRVRFPLCVLALLCGGCLWIKTEPVHVTVDVNLRVQKELTDFFQDIDKADPTMQPD
jgi:hypothetical protein